MKGGNIGLKEPRGRLAACTGAIRAEGCEVWGVLNVTPDSFSDGGLYLNEETAVARGRQMLDQGADVIDVGGESSRPAGTVYGAGAQGVTAEDEARRVVPVVRALKQFGARISIDTVKADVARQAIEAGAGIVNDVSCGASDELMDVAAETGVELVLMHTRGRGEVTGPNVEYADVVREVIDELLKAVERAVKAGVSRGRIWIDPGIGFAKTPRQSLELLARVDELAAAGYPVLVGPSRKSFVAEAAPRRDGARPAPGERLGGTAVAVAAAVLGGARGVRVHDVELMRQAVMVAQSMLEARSRRKDRPAAEKKDFE